MADVLNSRRRIFKTGELMPGMIAVIIAAALLVWGLFTASKSIDKSRASKLLRDRAPDVIQWLGPAKRAAANHGLPAEIVQAIIWQESQGDPNAIGGAGEVGLMQLKPDAVEDLRIFGYGDYSNYKNDPIENIKAGAGYLDLNMKPGRADSNLHLALRMYNQGPTGAFIEVQKSINYANQVIEKAKILGYNG